MQKIYDKYSIYGLVYTFINISCLECDLKKTVLQTKGL